MFHIIDTSASEDDSGCSAFEYACRSGNKYIVADFITNGARLEDIREDRQDAVFEFNKNNDDIYI